MTVSILGCGWFGMALGKALVQQGVRVNGSTTTAAKLPVLQQAGLEAYMLQLPLASGQVPYSAFFTCDVLVIAIPPRSRYGEGEQYVAKLDSLLPVIKMAQVKQVILISSTGIYADQNRTVTEATAPEPDTASGSLLLQAEQLFTGATSFKTSIVRFGGLVGPNRDPGRFFAGKSNVPNGLAPVNLIHLEDCIGICQEIIRQEFYGYIINACSPHHPAKKDFYIQAAIRAGLEKPKFIEELNEWKIVDSEVLKSILKYQFNINNWFDWLNS